jgi:mannosyltransferase OCH1-like enzyme
MKKRGTMFIVKIFSNAHVHIFLANILCFFCLCGQKENESNKFLLQLSHVDFYSSMGKGSKQYEKKFKDDYNHKFLGFLYELFQKNKNQFLDPASRFRIPKIIHQIWVGEKPLPQFYQDLTETWIKYHPDWQYILWTDEKVKELKLYNQRYYDAATSPSEKANILRYELLNEFGGVYADIDTECLRSFDPLHYCFDFYTGICPADCVSMLQNALIGCAPNHPIINKCIKCIEENMQKPNQFERNGVIFFSSTFLSMAEKDQGMHIALPATYFYPVNKYELPNEKSHIYPESFSIHYWGSTLEKKIALYNKVKKNLDENS